MTDDTDTEQTEYRLQDDVDRLVRAGLDLAGDETVTLSPDEATNHEDILTPVDGQDTDSGIEEVDE
jgi:hypothetical protein